VLTAFSWMVKGKPPAFIFSGHKSPRSPHQIRR
jgi:hypothetical protein